MNALINKKVKLLDMGLIDYKEAWDFQEELFKKSVDLKIENRKNETEREIPNYLISCQHPHVYTIGKSGDINNLLANEQKLKDIDASFYKINRGGDITYHGPGQLVVYPVIDLENFFTDIHKYLRLLEESVIQTLQEFSIVSGRIDGLTGVWLDHINKNEPRKICAMGVKTSRWVTMHGLALNVNTDLTYFDQIIPCGIDDKAVTSIQKELNKAYDINRIMSVLSSKIMENFGMNAE